MAAEFSPGLYPKYPMSSRRRYVARGVPGGYRIWDRKRDCAWGDVYEFVPDELLAELNGQRRPERITELLCLARVAKR